MKTLSRYSWLLPVISGGMVLICLVYCRIWWTPHPMTLADPDESFVCWMFCKTLSNYWLSLGVLFSLVSITGGIMMKLNIKHGMITTLAGGILILPVGIINFFVLYISKRECRISNYQFRM